MSINNQDGSITEIDMAYRGAQRSGKWTYAANPNGQRTGLQRASFYTLGGKELRLGPDGKFSAMLLPTHSGSGLSV